MHQQSRVAKGALLIMVISVAGKLIGFVREQVIAGYFGASQVVDAYLAAYSIPLLILNTVTSALCASFIPVFMQWRKQRTERDAWELVGGLLKAVTACLGLLTIVTFMAAPFIVRLQAPGFPPETRRLAVSLLRIIVPGTIFSGIASILVGLLNAHHRFGWSALSPLLLSLGTVVGAGILVPVYGIYGLAWATLAGMSLQFLALFWQVRRHRYPVIWSAQWLHPGLKQLVSMSAPIFVSTVCLQGYQVINRWLATGLEPGSLAALSYANKLVFLPVGLFVSALATAIYPTLSEMASTKDNEGYRGTLAAGFRMLLLIIVPAAMGLFTLREPIVKLAFERGAFDSLATTRTSIALAYAAFGLIGQACIPLLNNAFYSKGDSKTPVKISIVFAFLNALLSVILVRGLKVGGLALATTVSQLVSMALLIFFMTRYHQVRFGTFRFAAKLAVSSLAMGAVAQQVFLLLEEHGLIVSLGSASIVGVLVYFGLIFALRVEELQMIVRLVKKKLRHRLVA